jgi:hypothetical protein
MAGFSNFRPGQYTSGTFDVLRAKVDPREGARMRYATRIRAPPTGADAGRWCCNREQELRKLSLEELQNEGRRQGVELGAIFMTVRAGGTEAP